MTNPTPLHPGHYYHIYNRGNNRENIFIEDRNYRYFLTLYAQYILPIAITYAYCLLKNHFHFLIRLRTYEEQKTWQVSETCQVSEVFTPKDPSRQFSHLFNSYTKAINKAYGRTGSLFAKPFRRKLVQSDAYFFQLIPYINRNAQHHGLVDDFRDWKYGSYHTILSSQPTQLARADVLDLFGGLAAFTEAHVRGRYDEIEHLIIE